MRYTITGTDARGNITVYEETDEIRSAEERFFEACYRCDKVNLYDRNEYKNIMSF